MNYWLMKSEPQVYSIADLKKDRRAIWDGVRNYQARNFLRQMQPEDLAFFYHSNTKAPGIVGLMKIVENNLIDTTQFDATSPYYDTKAALESPRWQTVKVEFMASFAEVITLNRLKQEFQNDEFLLIKKGNRLSVMPVSESIAQQILKLSQNSR
jgi:predicted RNA-binding protein with PUA-like domain